MAEFSINIRDGLYAAELAAFDGVNDAERLRNMKKFVRQALKQKVIDQRLRAAQERANELFQAELAALDVALSE